MNQFSTAVSLALLFAILILPLVQPRLALISWLIQFPLEQVLQGNLQWFLTNDLVVNAAVVMVTAVSVLRLLITDFSRQQMLLNAGFISAVTVLAYGGVSVLWSQDRLLALETIRLSLPYGVVAIVLLPMTLSELSDFRRFRRWFLFFGCVLAVAVLTCPAFRFYGTRALVLLGGNVRGNPLIVAEVGGLLFFLAAMSREPGRGWIAAPLRLTAMILGMGMCLASGSRGQFLAAVLATFFAFPMARPVKNVGAVATTLIGVPIIAVTLFYTIRLFVSLDNVSRWTGESIAGGVEDRLLFVTRYLAAWIQNPVAWIVGFGTMSFSVVGGGLAGFVENFLVEVMIEEGIPMLCVLLWGISVAVFRTSRLAFSATTDPINRVDLVCILGLLLFYFVIGVKSYNIWTAYPFFLWMIVSLKLTLQAQGFKSAPASPPNCDDLGDCVVGGEWRSNS
jgi:hypothetical protein